MLWDGLLNTVRVILSETKGSFTASGVPYAVLKPKAEKS